MHTVRYTAVNGKTRTVVCDDWESAREISEMLVAFQDSPSWITDLETQMVSYQSNFKTGDKVIFEGTTYRVAGRIPGLDIVQLTPVWSALEEDKIMVPESKIIRQ